MRRHALRLVTVACWAVAAAFDLLPGETLSSEEATRLKGDVDAWFDIFADGSPELLVDGLQWPEGPTWIEGRGLYFTDTISAKLYRWNEDTREADVVLENSGGCGGSGQDPCMADALEPGANGLSTGSDYMNKEGRPSVRVAVCQHGARRLAFLDLETLAVTPLAAHYDGKRLNGPNDVAVAARDGSLYFTDPYYSFLEKSRPYDSVYTDEKSDLGFAGIYGYETIAGTIELLDDSLERPNGIAIANNTHLVVSECCQGHSDSCPAGEARWVVFRFAKYGKLREDVEPVRVAHSDHVTTGCADGLAFHEATQTLVASCPGGVCLVDLDAGEVRAKMYFGRKVSNVALGGGYGWFTAEGSLWRAKLRSSPAPRSREL